MRVSGLVPPVMTHRVNVGVSENRSMLPIHPVLTTSSPFGLVALLGELRRTPEIREHLILTVIQKRITGVYFSRQTAEQTAQAVINHSFFFSPDGALTTNSLLISDNF